MDAAAFEQVFGAFQDFHAYFAPLFGRREARGHSRHYLQALLVQSGERRNAENLSETVPASARVMQRFLAESPWDDDTVIGVVNQGHQARKLQVMLTPVLAQAELELIDRHQRMVERRIRAARFPAVKSLDTFDFPAIPSLNKALLMELARCEYIQRRENVIAVGNSGTGKTNVALGLGLAACQRGMSVGFTTVAALVHELIEARDERRLLNLQRQLSRLNLLIIDELGFVPLSRTGAELSQRYQRGSILVTTNLPFDEWTEVFGSERLTGALLDRLTHHVHILEMNGESYQLMRSQENAAFQAPDDREEE